MTWVELPDVVLRSETSGAGPRQIVLIHELGGSLDSFDGVVVRLPPQCRVLRYDQRGAGGSEKPRAAFSVDDHVRDLAGVMAAAGLDGPVCLVGVAAGCAIAVAFTLAVPSAVAGLVLCAPALTVAPDRRGYLLARSDAAARDGMRAIADASLDRSYPREFRDAAWPDYRARFLANDPVAYGHANRALAETTVAERLGDLATPCHVLAGRHDRLRPPDSVQAVAASISGARYTIVESGHVMATQAPGAVAEAIMALATQIDGRS